MDRPDRPNGPPGAGRGLPENPAQGRRAAAAAAMNNPLPPLPFLRDVPSNSNLMMQAPLSSGQVMSLVREAMKLALDENETQANVASGVSNELKPGVTINLSHKNISKLPDEVVDIIKDALERLALSHNSLAAFPVRFSECTSLRYLNVRNNKIKEFPLPLCDLKSLEILDLGRNKLRVLPPDIVKLSSLKVFAVQKNQISELPLCLGDMVSLQVLKLDGNPLKFPPREVLQVQASSPPNEGFLKESEVNEVAATAHIKRFLKERAMSNRVEADTTGDESSEGAETPRMPIKRAVSGRFPIKVNGADMPDLRSPALSRPPPIPSRSHFRGLSQQNTAIRKPGVMPLTIGNVNERVRSNSETLLQASRRDRPESRNRRMGIVSGKPSELGTLDETQANNRFSGHYRGLSHGSAMQGNGANLSVKSPASPAEQYLQRPVYVRRLSILPERRRVSKVFDPVLEAAKGILYSVFQIHPMIQMLMSLTSDTSDGTAKRSSLEIVFYNTSVHVEELEQEIQRHDPIVDEDVLGQRENENVQRACLTLVNAYAHVCTLLASNVDVFIDNGDPRYIRTLLTQLYNSIMELRVTTSGLSADEGYGRSVSRAAIEDTIRPRLHAREASVTPTADRPGPNGVNGTGGVIPRSTRAGTLVHNPSNLRVATDVSLPYINGTGRTATITSATPRSGESFASTSSASGGRGISDFTDEDRVFERIFLSLQKSTDLVRRTLPSFNNHFNSARRNAVAQRAPDHVLQCWNGLIQKCATTIQLTDMLKNRLSVIKLKEPGVRTPTFWNQCNQFIDAWAELGREIKRALDIVQLPMDTKARLRPIQVSMKDTMDIILASPWAYFITRNAGGGGAGPTSPYGSQVPTPVQPLPMTPQSAALGPAVQATVPSTPQSASFANAFAGGVFERADALISMGGLSISSRSGTTGTNSSTSSLSSVSVSSSALSSSSQDGITTPSSMLLSPVLPGTGPLEFRLKFDPPWTIRSDAVNRYIDEEQERRRKKR